MQHVAPSQVLRDNHGNSIQVPHPCTCHTERLSGKPIIPSTPDNLNLQGKLKKAQVIGSSIYPG